MPPTFIYKMKTYKISSTSDFFEFLSASTSKSDGPDSIFRGVTRASYKLLPSIGRETKPNGNPITVEEERRMLDIFKHRAYPFVKDYIENDFELLTIAQHHGLPTRLLDWTRNPLVAAFFSVQKDSSGRKAEPSAIYRYEPKHLAKLDPGIGPFDINHVRRFIPKHWDNRIIAQNGLFTAHPNPRKEWTSSRLSKWLIDSAVRKEVKWTLFKMGVHPATIFPDVDGIATHIKWLRTSTH